MPASPLARRLLLVAVLGAVLLGLVGFVFGAVGSKMFGTHRLLGIPEVHLPPQPIFPASSRDEHLGLITSQAYKDKSDKVGEGEKKHSTPLDITEFAVTNTLLSAWLATIVMVLFFVLGARRKSLVPGRLQGLVETFFEGVLSFSNGVVGPEMARKAFPVVATIFFFVLFNAWLALFPFYEFFGFVRAGHGFITSEEMKAPLLRSAGTDLNMPLALALISFVFVEYWGLRAHGFAYFRKFFAFGGLLRGKVTGLIDAFVGILEFISELVRLVSFTFRLFGNMTAGVILVVMFTFLVPFVAVQIAFGLELLVGLIQSIIFAGLTLVFLSLAVRHGEGE